MKTSPFFLTKLSDLTLNRLKFGTTVVQFQLNQGVMKRLLRVPTKLLFLILIMLRFIIIKFLVMFLSGNSTRFQNVRNRLPVLILITKKKFVLNSFLMILGVIIGLVNRRRSNS